MYRKSKKEEFYTRRAKEEGYPARSVYKLKEIDEKYKIFKQGDRVLDLGCAPGSWMLYIAQKIGKKGEVVGVDTDDLKIVKEENMIFIQKDVAAFLKRIKVLRAKRAGSSLRAKRGIKVLRAKRAGSYLKVEKLTGPQKQFDVIVSDLAPKTTGIKSADAINSIVLADKALAIAKLTLKHGGDFVCKIFEGELSDRFFQEVKKNFKFAKRFRPKAVSKDSREIYIIGMGFIKHA